MSIINGAQTTGSIGSLEAPPSANLLVSIRFIKCSDKSTIDEIIANNNRQNEMVPLISEAMIYAKQDCEKNFQNIHSCTIMVGKEIVCVQG